MTSTRSAALPTWASPPWLRAWALVALSAVMAGLGLAQAPWDRALFGQINALATVVPYSASALSVVGLGTALFVPAALIGLRRPQVPAALLLALLGGGLAVQLLKSGLALPRPAAVLGAQQLHVIGTLLKGRAMPSGHAALFATVATLAWLVPAGAWTRRRRWALATLLTLLAVAGALARVVVGAHWPSDVLAGAGLGVLAGLALLGTPRGRELVQALAAILVGKAGSRVMVALSVAIAGFLWVAERDYPLAEAWHELLALLGLAAAMGWWRLHPGPRGSASWHRQLWRT